MRQKFIKYLCDPKTLKPLRLTKVLAQNGGQISAGVLEGSEWYPVIGGVPRLLSGALKINVLQAHQEFLERYRAALDPRIVKQWQKALRAPAITDPFLSHQRRTAESFAYEWGEIYRESGHEKQNFFHFLSPFVGEADLGGKSVLDVGCGSGRFTKWAALSGAKVAIGSDLGETVEVAYQATKALPNSCIVQADIYQMPFRASFDLAFSIGVLHHLPRPQAGFSRLTRVLKSAGQLLIWVYNRRANNRAFYLYEPLRTLVRPLPKDLLYWLCYLPAGAVQLLNYLSVGLEKIGAANLARRIPFSYYARFPFNMKLNDAFDVLATPQSNYYYKEEIERWYQASQLQRIRSFEHPEAGITAIGQR